MKRNRIHEAFLGQVRHHNWDQRVRPGPRNPVQNDDGKIPPDGSKAPPPGRGRPNPPPDVYSNRPPDAIFVQYDSHGHARIFAYYAPRPGGEGGPGQASPDVVPLDASMVEALLQGLDSHSPAAQRNAGPESSRAPLWVRIPQEGASQEIFQSVLRMLSPNSTVNQDGLRALLSSAQFQQNFQGGKVIQGATQLLPNAQLLAVLLPPGALNVNPEAAKALLIAQGLPSQLIQNIPDRALAGALNSLLVSSRGTDAAHFLQTVLSVLSLAGLPQEEVQAVLLGLLENAQVTGAVAKMLTPEMLQQLAGRLFAANNPQVLGLNQMVQNSFGQGIAQILNSFIRVFLGGALMQGQSAWPQVVPNERMLAELGGLFAARREKRPEDQERKKRVQKRRGSIESVDGELHRRVEAREDVSDEPPSQGNSLFIEMDEGDD